MQPARYATWPKRRVGSPGAMVVRVLAARSNARPVPSTDRTTWRPSSVKETGEVPVGMVPRARKVQPAKISKRVVDVAAKTLPRLLVYKPRTGPLGNKATGLSPGML